MIKITRFFFIHVLVLPLIALSFAVGSPTTFFLTYGVVLLHELCHLFAALLLNVPVRYIVVMPFGMTLKLSDNLLKHPKKEVLIAAAGPASNLVMLTLCFFFHSATAENAALFATANLAILFLNLLPVLPLDGGRILRAVLTHRLGIIPCAKIMRRISSFVILLLAVLGVWLLICFRGNISLLIIAAFLSYSFVSEKKSCDLSVMRMMLSEKELLVSDGFIPTRRVTLRKSAFAKRILRKLNFSSFYIITVLDDSLSVCAHVTESDIIRTVTRKGYRATLSDCIKTPEDTKVPAKEACHHTPW
ncbi:MAG: M50 family metallopeptidase [Clostridia bacterium]|nr:M50 family metallopeptidase [Clostridia bacterium]